MGALPPPRPPVSETIARMIEKESRKSWVNCEIDVTDLRFLFLPGALYLDHLLHAHHLLHRLKKTTPQKPPCIQAIRSNKIVTKQNTELTTPRISKPRQRQQLIRPDIHQIILLKTLGHNTRIHLNSKHGHIYRTEYFIHLSNLLFVFEVDSGVEIRYFWIGVD